MNSGNHSSRTDKSPSFGIDSGYMRKSSKEGLEKIESRRFKGVEDVFCQKLEDNTWKNVVRAISMVGKCGPDVEKCEISRRRRSNGGAVRLV
jgi:hypothetical protein